MEGSVPPPMWYTWWLQFTEEGFIFPGLLPSRPGPRPNGNSTAMAPNLLTHGSGIRWLEPELAHTAGQVVFTPDSCPVKGPSREEI